MSKEFLQSRAGTCDKNFDPAKTAVAYSARVATVRGTVEDKGYTNMRNFGSFKSWVECGRK